MGGEREVLSDARYRRRLNLVTRALMAICGKNIENRLLTQEAILRVSSSSVQYFHATSLYSCYALSEEIWLTFLDSNFWELCLSRKDCVSLVAFSFQELLVPCDDGMCLKYTSV